MRGPGIPGDVTPDKGATVGITGKQRGRHIFPEGVGGGSRSYAADGVITGAGIALLTKTSIGAYTLAAPSSDGIGLTIVSRTAFAHVVTATGLIDDGVTGGSKNQITFAAFAGASIHLVSAGAKWNTVALKGTTVP